MELDEYMYMCLRFTQEGEIRHLPTFFKNYESALFFAYKEAIILPSQPWYSDYGIPEKDTVFNIKIFQIPFGLAVSLTTGDDDYMEFYVKTIYDPKTTKIMIIQKKWREIYNTRLVSAWIIKRHIRSAIANPKTQLCKNRLYREFNNM